MAYVSCTDLSAPSTATRPATTVRLCRAAAAATSRTQHARACRTLNIAVAAAVANSRSHRRRTVVCAEVAVATCTAVPPHEEPPSVVGRT